MSPPEVFTVTGAGGVPIAVSRCGSGEALVFLHGTGADRSRWQAVIELLPSYQALSPDRRGRGESGDNTSYSLDAEIEDLRCVLEHVNTGQGVKIVAHSYGALVALATLQKHSSLFSRLVLYEAPLAVAGEAEFIDLEQLQQLESRLEEQGPSSATEYFLRRFPMLSEAEIAEMKCQPGWASRCAAASSLARELRAAFAFQPDFAALGNISLPVLIVLGGDSIPPFHISAKKLRDSLPGSQLEVLPGETHRAMDTNPEKLAGILCRFLGDPL